MRVMGPLTEWDDARGFGFVVSQDGRTRAFVHIKAFAPGARRPTNGDLVSFAPVTDARGRITATAIQFHGEAAPPPRSAKLRRRSMPHVHNGSYGRWRYVLAGAWLVVLALAGVAGVLSIAVPVIIAVLSLMSFLGYRHDKRAARAGQWRTQEATLHAFDLVGGWPGGLAAQTRFHHKTVKASYQFVFWLTVALNITALTWLTFAGGAAAELRAGFTSLLSL